MSITSLVVFLIILGFDNEMPTVVEFHNMQSCTAAITTLEAQRRVVYAAQIKNGWELRPLIAVCAPQNIETKP